MEAAAGPFTLVPARLSRITGTVGDSRGRAGSDHIVLLSSARSDGALLSTWNMSEVDARGIFVIRNVPPGEYRLDVVDAAIDDAGRFRVPELPPGDYFAAAVPVLEPGEWAEPENLDLLRAHAAEFSLAEGESKSLRLVVRVKVIAEPLLGAQRG